MEREISLGDIQIADVRERLVQRFKSLPREVPGVIFIRTPENGRLVVISRSIVEFYRFIEIIHAPPASCCETCTVRISMIVF